MPVLNLLYPETAHNFAKVALKLGVLPKAKKVQDPILRTKLWGLEFENPVGLAAGFDKNGHYVEEMSHLGFGFIEIGSVTAQPSLGNAQPRLFRVKNDGAIINRMGLNNLGADALGECLSGQVGTTAPSLA